MDRPKVLGQLTPSSGVQTNLFVCASGTWAVSSSLVICNTSTINAVVSVYLNSKTLLKNLTVVGEDTYIATIGITAAAGDIVSVISSRSDTDFSLLGVERS